MKCNRCGAECEGNFCSSCGTKVDVEAILSPSVQQQVYPQTAFNNPSIQKKKKPFFLKWWFIVLVVLIIGVVAPSFGKKSNHKTEAVSFQWTEIELHKLLPEPANTYGEISVNNENHLDVYIHNVTKAQYKEYIEACKLKGYIIDIDTKNSTFTAFNETGHKLYMFYNESDKEMCIRLETPEQMSDFEWPASGLGAMLPTTESTYGNIHRDNSNLFIIHVGNTAIESYNAYVKLCERSGFSIDYSKEDTYYSAKNSDGYELTVRYLGFNIIEISIETPERDVTPSTTITDSKTETTTPANTNEIRKEFKAALDSYEAFFDEYVAIVKKYSKNPTDLSILNDYTQYMGKYSEMVEALAKLGEEEMNSAELAYYLDVQTRINKKLLEVAI